MAFAGSDVKFASFDFENSGNNTLVAAVAGKKILVLSLFLIAASAMDVRFEDGAGGDPLTGVMNVGAKTPVCLPYNQGGWFETTAANLLNLELGGAQQVSGCVTYVET